MFFSTPFRERREIPYSAPLYPSPLPVHSLSFIQFSTETVQKLFPNVYARGCVRAHVTSGRDSGEPYGRIYVYFLKIRETLRGNAGFASSGPPLAGPRFIRQFSTLA